MKAHHFPERHGEHAERVVRAQVVLGREREAREIRQVAEVRRAHPRPVELRPVVRHPLICAAEGPPEPVELEAPELLAARELVRVEPGGEAAVSHGVVPRRQRDILGGVAGTLFSLHQDFRLWRP